MLRAAIVGLGRWGRSLVASVQGKSEAIRFVAAHTRTPQSAQVFCREHGILLRDSFEALIGDPSIEALVLATPHSRHADQIMAAAAAGKHVLVEKPLTLDRASAEQAAAAAHRASVVLAVGFCRRFHPGVVELRRRLREGRLGSLLAMVAQHTTSSGRFIPPDNWRARAEEAPGGALTAVGVHSIDHMIEFAGRVREVLCVTGRYLQASADDTTTILLRFDGGATGTIFCSIATATNFSITVYGTKGLAEISRPTLERFRFVPASEHAPTGPVTAPADELLEHRGFDMLHAELTQFARSIRQGTPYPVPIEEVLHGMAVFGAVVRSAKSRRIEAVD